MIKQENSILKFNKFISYLGEPVFKDLNEFQFFIVSPLSLSKNLFPSLSNKVKNATQSYDFREKSI